MKKVIVDFVRSACVKYGLEAIYYPDTDVYSIMKNGRAIQNFETGQFYQYPRMQRMKEYRALLKGLSHNLGESYAQQVFMRKRFGKKLYPL